MRSAWRRRIFCKGGAGVNTLLIAAAAMAGGAALGFSLCWVATRLAAGNHAAARTSGSGQKAAPVEPPTEREEPPDAGIK